MAEAFCLCRWILYEVGEGLIPSAGQDGSDMEISAGFIIFLVLISPFALWITIFFIGTFTGLIRLLRSRHPARSKELHRKALPRKSPSP